MTDRDFEAMLQENVSALPPSDTVVHGVTPWRKAVNRILWGLVLCSVTFHFWYLNFILPAIGFVLMLYGFRALRHENKGFFAGFWISVIRCGIMLAFLILNTTLWAEKFNQSGLQLVLGLADMVLTVAIAFCLWSGFRGVQRKAGFPPRAGGAIGLAVWYVLIIVLGVLEYQGILFGLLMVAAYGFIIRGLYRLSKELDEAGYTVETKPLRVPDWAVGCGLGLLLAVGMMVGYLCFSQYPMAWTPVENGEQAGLEDIRENLISLGFPEEILEDLSPEDLAACQNAVQVLVDQEVYPVNDGRWVEERVGNTINSYVVYDVRELQMTGIAVELAGEREHWKIFHHFLWLEDTGFWGTEALQLWPTSRLDGWGVTGEFSGRVLYTRNGVDYAAPYYSLGEATYTSTSFLGSSASADVFAAFSLPRGGEACRGYVTYEVIEMREGCLIDAWCNYVHQRSWLQYPVESAMAHKMQGLLFDDGIFKTVQDAIQFDPWSSDPQPY